MTKIGILSDTHGYVHPKVFDFFEKCDQIWHAGDIGSIHVLDELTLIAPVKAVYGNCDSWDVRAVIQEHLLFNCEKYLVSLMHITGYPNHYEHITKKIIQLHQPTIIVGGHSHILRVMQDKANKLLFVNPGAAGKNGFHTHITFLRFEIAEERMFNLEVFDEPRI
ncbi:MAG: metallophosphatase family protein [Bacteroidales bacterium]|jgi:putative phosphoesterase|nr:metallophosphatase family protein [Bacteroidales bacterium]